jgi:hypothetical protein
MVAEKSVSLQRIDPTQQQNIIAFNLGSRLSAKIGGSFLVKKSNALRNIFTFCCVSN